MAPLVHSRELGVKFGLNFVHVVVEWPLKVNISLEFWMIREKLFQKDYCSHHLAKLGELRIACTKIMYVCSTFKSLIFQEATFFGFCHHFYLLEVNRRDRFGYVVFTSFFTSKNVITSSKNVSNWIMQWFLRNLESLF